eukprot:scaffold15596_cov22-Tisochrysis_lutea.AAC.2
MAHGLDSLRRASVPLGNLAGRRRVRSFCRSNSLQATRRLADGRVEHRARMKVAVGGPASSARPCLVVVAVAVEQIF